MRPTTLKSGLQFVNPMAKVVEMSVQTQEIKETMDVPSKEGMTMTIEVSVLYHLDPEKASDIYRSVGSDYAAVLLEPQFRSVTRGVTAAYEAKALYTSEREHLSQLITNDLKLLVEPRGIFIETTPLRKLTLPNKLRDAIEEKLSADQESQRMQFVLTKETQEAERKRIEAKGIADFQQIVTTGISDKLLEWKGIEATQDLAKSPNSKIVIIGNAKNGLPLDHWVRSPTVQVRLSSSAARYFLARPQHPMHVNVQQGSHSRARRFRSRAPCSRLRPRARRR